MLSYERASKMPAFFQSTADSELIVSLIVACRASADLVSGILQAMEKIEDPYSLVMLTEKMFGIRDPMGCALCA